MARKPRTQEAQDPPEGQMQLPGFAETRNPYSGRREVVIDTTGMFDLVDDDQGEAPEKES